MRKIIQTMLKTVWSVKSTSTPNFVPVTGPINSTLVRGVRVAWELLGKTPNVEVQPAYRMSDDGITWSSTVTGLVGSYSSSTGWSYADASAVVNVDLKSFVQFGFLVRNTTGSAIEMAQASLRLTHADLVGQTFNAGPERVWSDGSTSQIFHPLIGPMPLERVDSYRGSFELEADSGDAQLQMAYQVSDDGITWYSGATSAPAGSFATFGAERTSEGITYGSTFATLTMDVPRQLIRWGLACRNGAAGVSESCAGSLRIDVRGT